MNAKTLLLTVVLGIGTATAPLAYAGSEEEEFIGLMESYLEVAHRWIQMAETREAAVFFAIEGITEIYEERGELRDAGPHLERILEKYGENRTLRTMIRFKLRDIYNQTDQHEKALQQLEEVIAESVQ